MKYATIILLLFITSTSLAKIWTVDPAGTYPSPFSVRNLVDDGDTIYIEAAVYKNQRQTYFYKHSLLIRGINGRPRIEGGSTLAANANGKALFVMNGAYCHVDNIEFANASVPDLNGAGIRQEGCGLLVSNCYFTGNEMGILGGNGTVCNVTIEHCIFTNNGNPKRPGFQHNVYINHIDTLTFRYNFSFDASAEGHELKSRARNNIIIYNYIANFNSGDSRNIDLPNGGGALIMGNIIEQGENSVNSNILGYGLEGLTNPGPYNLWVMNNTFINRKSKGNFVQVKSGTDTLTLKNNIMVGAKTSGLILGSPTVLDSATNLVSNAITAPMFKADSTRTYSLERGSPCIDAGTYINASRLAYILRPDLEYHDTASFGQRRRDLKVDIGAYEGPKVISVDFVERVKSIQIYPNPSSSKTIRMNGLSKKPTPFEVYSISGKRVYGGLVINGQLILDLPAGIYTLRIPSRQFVQKIVLE